MHALLKIFIFLFIAGSMFIFSCNRKRNTALPPRQMVADLNAVPAEITNQIYSIIKGLNDDPGMVKGLSFSCIPLLGKLYDENGNEPLWLKQLTINPKADTFQLYLANAANDGLFRNDYHYDSILRWRSDLKDSLKQHDATLWAKLDLALTDGFLHVVQDLKQGRLLPDSQLMCHHADANFSFFSKQLDKYIKGENLDSLLIRLQPVFPGYDSLHMLVKNFVGEMDTARYTYINYPFTKGSVSDSIKMIQNLTRRLTEEGLLNGRMVDSVALSEAIKLYQHKHKIAETGTISSFLVEMLNLTDRMKFARIAITLDRYKAMPLTLPEQFILVNLPSFWLKVYRADTVALASKIICGKASTPTPFINGAISEIITFPTWTVPASIVEKEIIPGMKKSPGYLSKKGLSIYDKNEEWVDPDTVNWQKYKKGIPYKVMQGSGHNNALGVIKFNFFNPFDIYLHDTNQRYLFKKIMRALSHGCIRVEQWENLAAFIAQTDSLNLAKNDNLNYNFDSINTWIENRERHIIKVKNRLSLYIRYFSCEAINGKIHFYEDIYKDDKHLNEKYFRNKQLVFN